MKTWISAAALSLVLAGCSVNQQQLATQYATLKLLEGDHVTQEAVLSRVDRVRLLLDGEYVATEAVYEAVGWDSLAPSDRLLVSAIVADVGSVSVGDRIDTDAARVVLDWIEQAAEMQ